MCSACKNACSFIRHSDSLFFFIHLPLLPSSVGRAVFSRLAFSGSPIASPFPSICFVYRGPGSTLRFVLVDDGVCLLESVTSSATKKEKKKVKDKTKKGEWGGSSSSLVPVKEARDRARGNSPWCLAIVSAFGKFFGENRTGSGCETTRVLVIVSGDHCLKYTRFFKFSFNTCSYLSGTRLVRVARCL